MSFVPNRNGLASRAVSVGKRLHSTTLANPVLANVVAKHDAQTITPYLGIRARLSQIWINRWTILLILILVRTLLAVISMQRDIGLARKDALSACTAVETAGSALASMPHYLSQGVNQLTVDGVEKAVNGLMQMLLLTVTGVENLVLFIINIYTSTYVCLITLVVGGALHSALALIEDITGFLNTTLHDIGGDIDSVVNTFGSALNDAIKGIDDVGSVFGDKGAIPTLNLTSQLEALDNLQLPSNFTSDLQTLNGSIPTFSQVQNFTDGAIRFPFEQIRTLINESLPKYTLDASIFPVPAKQSLTFCSSNNGIDDFFNDLIDVIYEARKISIAILLILAVLVCVPMANREVRRYRNMEQTAALSKSGEMRDSMEIVYMASQPTTSGLGLTCARTLVTTRRQQLVHWTVAYATTLPAMFVLSLAIAGLFSCLCRYIILLFVTKEIPALAEEVAEFAAEVVRSLEAASEEWANGTNTAILGLNSQINNDIFGWVNTSTHAVNNTLNVFINESITVLNDTFAGTVLYEPVLGLFNCLIGLKVASVEKGLTWVSDNAHVDFPLLPNNTFSLGAVAKLGNDSSASSLLSAPNNGTREALDEIVDTLIAHFANSIRTEALISTGVLGVWVLIALIGICRALWLFRSGSSVGGPIYRDRGDSIGSSSTSVARENAPPPEAQQDIKNEKTPHSSTMPTRVPVPAWKPIPLVRVQPPAAGDIHSTAPYTLKPRPFPRFVAGAPCNVGDRERDGHLRPAPARQVSGSIVPTHEGSQRTSHVAGVGRSTFERLGR